MNYYYFVASLPPLALEGDPPFSSEHFADLCAEHLSPRDLEALESLADPTRPGNHAFVLQWRDAETQIRNTVARARALRLGKDAAGYLRPVTGLSVALEKRCSDAMALSNPLERERALDTLRWNLADELAGLETFSLSAVLAYGVKLYLVERWTAMNEDAGRQKLEAMASKAPAPAETVAAS